MMISFWLGISWWSKHSKNVTRFYMGGNLFLSHEPSFSTGLKKFSCCSVGLLFHKTKYFKTNENSALQLPHLQMVWSLLQDTDSPCIWRNMSHKGSDQFEPWTIQEAVLRTIIINNQWISLRNRIELQIIGLLLLTGYFPGSILQNTCPLVISKVPTQPESAQTECR